MNWDLTAGLAFVGAWLVMALVGSVISSYIDARLDADKDEGDKS